MAVTGSDNTAAPRRASARTMSRSLAIPSTVVPSCETTTAPIRCSARTARSCRTVVSGVTVTTWVPLTRSTSLIRIGTPRHWYAADYVPVPIPQAGYFNPPGPEPVVPTQAILAGGGRVLLVPDLDAIPAPPEPAAPAGEGFGTLKRM